MCVRVRVSKFPYRRELEQIMGTDAHAGLTDICVYVYACVCVCVCVRTFMYVCVRACVYARVDMFTGSRALMPMGSCR